MAALTWNQALALQQPRMDDTHREFVELLNAVERALDAGALPLEQALDRFVQHTEAHFAQEDEWMQRVGFAAQNCHGLQHAQVLELVREVHRRLRDEADVDVVRALVPALAEWFPVHAQSMDAGLVQSMQDAGFDPETGALRRPPLPEAEPQAGCGSGRCG
jgi:hemerythrin